MYSPLTIDTNNVLHVEASPRRYSASAALSPPNHHYNLHPPPIVNVTHASPQQDFSQESNRRSSDQQWHIPIFLYGCNKERLAESLLQANEQQWTTLGSDAYHDCTIDDSDSTNDAKTVITTTSSSQNTKFRKRGMWQLMILYICNFVSADNSRRYDEDNPFPDDKQVENMRESLDYAFATGKAYFSPNLPLNYPSTSSILQKLPTGLNYTS